MAEYILRIHKQNEVRRFCENFSGSSRPYVDPAARPAVHRSNSGRVAKASASAPAIACWSVRTLTIPVVLKAVDLQREHVVMPCQRAIVLNTLNTRVVQRLKELDKAQHDLKPALAGRPRSSGYLYDEMIGSAERSSGYVN